LWPEYKRIDSKVTFKPLFVNESSIVIEKIKMKMPYFLDPVRGGKFGKGFDFGEKIYVPGSLLLLKMLKVLIMWKRSY